MKRCIILTFALLCLLTGCGKQEVDPALLQNLEECDAACSVRFDRVYTENGVLGRVRESGLEEWEVRNHGIGDPLIYPIEGEEALLLEFLVSEDYFGNLSTKEKDLTGYQGQSICVYIGPEEQMTEPLYSWLRTGPVKAALFLTVMEDPPEWATKNRTDTVFRLLSPDSYSPWEYQQQEELKLIDSLREYAETHEKARILRAVWCTSAELHWPFGEVTEFITDFYWTEEDCG